MLHNGSFIHHMRRPAGVKANQIMALSAPAYWPAVEAHMTPCKLGAQIVGGGGGGGFRGYKGY